MTDTSATGRSAAAVRRVVGDAAGVEGVERTVSTDQANLSIAVDERYLVKWFPEPIERSSLDVLQHLSSVGFAHMPHYLGSVDEGTLVVATVSEFVPGATDGWQWYVADVLAWIDGAAGLDGLVATAAQMGVITASLHDALADDRPQFDSLDAVRAHIAERRAVAVAETTGPVGDRLRARLGQIDGALSALDQIDRVPVQRIHGDLHAGQFLRAADQRLLVTDFDGDPMTVSADRAPLQPIERDVAGLLQSIDHVGRVAARRRPAADVATFITPAIDAAERSYRAVRALDSKLLFALRVAQELHEYAYAATRLPVWSYVPDEATQALFPDEDVTT